MGIKVPSEDMKNECQNCRKSTTVKWLKVTIEGMTLNSYCYTTPGEPYYQRSYFYQGSVFNGVYKIRYQDNCYWSYSWRIETSSGSWNYYPRNTCSGESFTLLNGYLAIQIQRLPSKIIAWSYLTTSYGPYGASAYLFSGEGLPDKIYKKGKDTGKVECTKSIIQNNLPSPGEAPKYGSGGTLKIESW